MLDIVTSPCSTSSVLHQNLLALELHDIKIITRYFNREHNNNCITTLMLTLNNLITHSTLQ